MVTKSIHIAFTILTLLSITLHLVVGHGTHKISKCICLRANKPDGDAEVDIKSIKVLLIYKFGAIVVTLIASAAGVILPILGKKIAALCPDKGTFLLVKAYSAGIILCTAFVHILPKAYECLTSPCLGEDSAWANFPFTSLAVMLGALLTLMVNSIGSRQFRKADQVQHFDVAMDVYNHDHSPLPQGSVRRKELNRFRITSQVLEIGVVVHSVIIGVSMGTSLSLDTIKPLIVALSFHQFFEGIGLGGCLVQASFMSASTMLMALVFSITTPLGIAIGIGLMNVYDETSPIALIVQGLLNSIAAGILIYMALVDLLAPDFMNPKIQNNTRLFYGAKFTLLLGVASMAVIAIWA